MTFLQRQRTLLAVLGRSGSGKTSLLSALIGDLPIEHGSLFLGDLDIKARSEQVSNSLGYVPQDTNTVYSSLTVRQLLRYSFHLRDPGTAQDREKRITEVCADLDLTDQLKQDQVVSTLPGGEKRRVSIAVELLNKPTLLILDEPTSGLDPGRDQEIMKQLRAYAEGKTGTTGDTNQSEKMVIVTTHSAENLNIGADEVLVVADVEGCGHPIFFGRPDQLLPRSTWTATLS